MAPRFRSVVQAVLFVIRIRREGWLRAFCRLNVRVRSLRPAQIQRRLEEMACLESRRPPCTHTGETPPDTGRDIDDWLF